MRGTWVYRDGRLVEKGGPDDVRVVIARSDMPAPMLLSDTMDPTEHPCTGEFMTSKSKFRQVTRANGCIEVGNDSSRLRPKTKPAPDREAIRHSIKKAFGRVQ